MNKQFIDTACMSMMTKYNYQSNMSKKHFDALYEEITQDVYNVITSIKLDDYSIFEDINSLPKLMQTDVIESFLITEFDIHDTNSDIITEGIVTTILLTALVSFIFSQIFPNKISASVMKIASKLSIEIGRLSKFVTSISRETNLRYIVIQKNSTDCYRKCGVTPREMSMLSYAHVSNSFNSIIQPAEQHRVQCLKKCYMMNVIELIVLLSESYFKCLYNTADRDIISNLNNISDSNLIHLLSGLQVSKECDIFRKELTRSFVTFDKMLDLFYKNLEEMSATADMDDLRKVLLSKLVKSKTKTYHKFNKPNKR